MGRAQQAKETYEIALSSQQNAIGTKHIDIIKSLEMLGNFHCRMGNILEAKKYHKQAYEDANEICGENHPQTMKCLSLFVENSN